jgi:hypothetical protein
MAQTPLLVPQVIPANAPPSAPGIVQPVFKTGSATSPPASSYLPTFTPFFPPPTMGSVVIDPPGVVNPATVPPSIDAPSQPVFETGSASVPLPADMYEWTTVWPHPPVTMANTMMIGSMVPPIIATTQNIAIGGWGPGAGPQEVTPPEWDVPDLEDGESEGDFMARCIAFVEEQGADETVAAQVCQEAYDAAQEARHAGTLHHGDAELPQRQSGAVLQQADADELHQPEPPTHRGGKRVSPRPAKRHKNR